MSVGSVSQLGLMRGGSSIDALCRLTFPHERSETMAVLMVA